LCRSDEAVHPPAVLVLDRALLYVRAAGVDLVRVVVGLDALAGLRIGDADGDLPLRVPREAVRAGVGPEVAVERPVLLHDEHDVPDLVDAGRGARGGTPSTGVRNQDGDDRSGQNTRDGPLSHVHRLPGTYSLPGLEFLLRCG